MADPNNPPSNSDVANAGYPRVATECNMDNLADAAQVGGTVPISQHQVTSTNNPAATANVGYPRLASGTHSAEASEQHIPAPKANNQPSSARAINAKSTKTPRPELTPTAALKKLTLIRREALSKVAPPLDPNPRPHLPQEPFKPSSTRMLRTNQSPMKQPPLPQMTMLSSSTKPTSTQVPLNTYCVEVNKAETFYKPVKKSLQDGQTPLHTLTTISSRN